LGIGRPGVVISLWSGIECNLPTPKVRAREIELHLALPMRMQRRDQHVWYSALSITPEHSTRSKLLPAIAHVAISLPPTSYKLLNAVGG
jgi:hypothetical protein